MNNHEELIGIFKSVGHEKTIFIGFDIGKYYHVCQICNGYKEPLMSAFKFNSTESGYKEFKLAFDDILKINMPDYMIFGCEPSGTYYLNLMNQLSIDYPNADFRLVNPLATSAQRKMEMEHNKSDPIDVNAILELMLQGLSYPLPIQDQVYDEIKEYVRYYDKLSSQLVGLRNRILLCIDELYPGFRIPNSTYFNSQAGKQFLRVLPDPRLLKSMNLVDILKYFEEAGEHLSAQMATRFSLAAKDILIPDKPVIKAKINTLKGVIKQYELTEELKMQTKLEIEQIASQFTFSKEILKLVGLGPLTLGRIIAYLNNPYRFSNGDQVAKYAGLVPRHSSSGIYSGKESLTHMGHPQLRSVTVQLTQHLISSTGYFTAFYNHLVIDKGKDINLAIVATAHKVLRVIYHMMIFNEKFNPPSARNSELSSNKIERVTKQKLKQRNRKGTVIPLTQINSEKYHTRV